MKAWVNFNGMNNTYGAAQTIRDRYNIASVVWFSEGQYQVTFAEALANANYVVVGTANGTTDGNNPNFFGTNTNTTSGFRVNTKNRSGSNNNCALVTFLVLGSNVPGGSNAATPSGGQGGGTIGWGNLPSNFTLP